MIDVQDIVLKVKKDILLDHVSYQCQDGLIHGIVGRNGSIPYYSGYQNLKILADIQGKVSKKRICQIMEQVGLNPRERKCMKKYSLGMRQRLGIAQALMEDQELIVLDEPFNGLDKNGVSEMREYFMQLKEKGKTILISSHNSDDINFLCDTIIEMDKGRIVR